MRKSFKLFLVFLLFIFLKNELAHAFVSNYFRQQLPLLRSLPYAYRQLEIYAAARHSGVHDVSTLENFLYREQLHPFLAMQVEKKYLRNFETYRWQFALHGKPLCHDYFVHAIQHAKFFYVNGKLPQLNMSFGIRGTSVSPDLDDALAEIERYFPHKLARTELLSAKDCWKIVDGEPHLVLWKCSSSVAHDVGLLKLMGRWFIILSTMTCI